MLKCIFSETQKENKPTLQCKCTIEEPEPLMQIETCKVKAMRAIATTTDSIRSGDTTAATLASSTSSSLRLVGWGCCRRCSTLLSFCFLLGSLLGPFFFEKFIGPVGWTVRDVGHGNRLLHVLFASFFLLF
jgi:hypothetical protein